MKKVLSISLGSSSRDHKTQATFMDELFELVRLGVDGDWDRFLALYAKYDGQVDAFGVGGTLFYLQVDKRRYCFRDCKRIRECVHKSKIGDGNGIKHLLAPRALAQLERETGISLKGAKAFKTNAVDRWGLAQALIDFGCEVTFGDLMLNLDIGIPLKKLSTVKLIATLLCPIVVRLPYVWFYPVGKEQDRQPSRKYVRYYEQADVIAGDFMQVRQYLPDDLSDKIIVTNTTTAQNVEELKRRNLKVLVTTTPRLEGRSFGTNVMEAVLRTLIDKPDDEIDDVDFLDMFDRIPLVPQVTVLN
jgi:hypothetical protein